MKRTREGFQRRYNTYAFWSIREFLHVLIKADLINLMAGLVSLNFDSVRSVRGFRVFAKINLTSTD